MITTHLAADICEAIAAVLRNEQPSLSSENTPATVENTKPQVTDGDLHSYALLFGQCATKFGRAAEILDRVRHPEIAAMCRDQKALSEAARDELLTLLGK